MKGYTIQHSIDLLEKLVEDLEARPSGGGSAAQVSYDNTSSHLMADDVQEAIDELNTAIGQIDTGVNFSSTEQKVGKWLGEDLYAKTIDIGALPSSTTAGTYPHSVTGNIVRYEASAIDDNGVCIQLPFYSTAANYNIGIYVNSTNVVIECQRDSSAYSHCYVTLYYTKTAPAANTRKKSSK